ncbi:MAG: nucleotide pyrophosphohydrolase [Candidatus Muirbacterium halophilum]|nr:nucleotide pyrophosphohydrolase [Candidatus Muirbacterium halophilum]MCK9475352.1 nucleotide pyrophosphohydrolase [Candidatus Muirbacterium halophilum]
MKEFQKKIDNMFGHRDKKRDFHKNFAWFVEEVGELSKAIRIDNRENEKEEFADVLAWLFSLANARNIDLEEVFLQKYHKFCSKCGNNPCKCIKY